jgi:hypothetical protein
MSHWLEEAEREERRKKKHPSQESARIQDKIFRIQQNYEANKEPYESFVKYLFDICERANNLPQDKKIPWGMIDFRAKESKLNNHLYHASTSERMEKTVVTKSFPFVKRQHYKHLRSIYFNVSKKMDFAEIEVRDDYLAKTRLSSDDKEKFEVLNDGLPRLKMIFEYEIKNLDRQLAITILDWLAFKSEVKSLPFGEEQLKYRKKEE